MSEHADLLYQGVSRRSFLGYLHRLCIVQHRDDLIALLCPKLEDAPLSAQSIERSLVAWNRKLQQTLQETILSATGSKSEMAAQVIGLTFDIEGQAQVILGILEQLCSASSDQNERRADQLLWNVLSQHFKDKMDQLDSFGGGPGVHRLQVMRRLEQLRRELEEKRRLPYADMAELAADLLAEIQKRKLSNMPGTVRTILEYLYELDARYQTSLDNDEKQIDVVSEFIADPNTLIQLEQCLEKLSPELYQALSIKHGLNDEAVFLREIDFREHYGFGWETLRKRAAQALKNLMKCLSDDSPREQT